MIAFDSKTTRARTQTHQEVCLDMFWGRGQVGGRGRASKGKTTRGHVKKTQQE